MNDGPKSWDEVNGTAHLNAVIDGLKADKRIILEERDRTFGVMLARAEAAEQKRAEEWQRAQGAEERNRKLKAKLKAAEARVRALEAALLGVMIGGNHLVTLLPTDILPPYTDPLVALEKMGAGPAYDAWCCWRSIMLARSKLEAAGPT